MRRNHIGPIAAWLSFVCLAEAVAATQATVVSPDTSRPMYFVGVVPQFDTRHVQETWLPILDELRHRTGMHLVLRGSPTIPAFEREFIRGEFDFACMNPYHILPANQKQGYFPLARDTGQDLHGVIVVRKDSPIQVVEELDRKPVAFPSKNALGASLMLRAAFHDQYRIEVIPRYVRSHSSVYLNVVLGETVAGGGVQKTLSQQKPEIRDALRMLYRTGPVPSHPFSAHPRVPRGVSGVVGDALLAMGAEEQGRRLLAKVPIERIGVASMEDYRELADLGLGRFFED